MNLIRITIVAIVIFSMTTFPAAADCLGLAQGLSSAYMADRGDGKGISLMAQNGRCGYSRNDRDYRWRKISQRYDAFNKAVAAIDTDRIVRTAKDLRSIRNRGSMYKSCFNTMVANARIIGFPVDEGIRAISLGRC